MRSYLLLILLSLNVWAVEPLEPRAVPSAPGQTLPVSLHPELTTMLVFPEPISMIVGSGLTDGTSQGFLQFDHRKGSGVVTFRPLQTANAVFAQIISGESVYFCRFNPAPRPDSVVRIGPAVGAQANEVPIEDVLSQRLALPKERLLQFIELTRSASILSGKLPDEYQDSQELEVAMLRRVGPLETRIEKIRRFPKSDVLVFFGTIRNLGNNHASITSDQLQLLVGQSSRLIPNGASPLAKTIHVGGAIPFECVLAGDGQGNRKHISIRNRFALDIAPVSNP